MSSHRDHAKPRTLNQIGHLQCVEVNWSDFDANLVAAAHSKPLLSCGYSHCSALVVFSSDGFASLAHMLTIGSKREAREYVDEAIDQLKKLGRKDLASLNALIIGGAGIDFTQAACKDIGLNVLATYFDTSQKGFDVLVHPDSQTVKVFCENYTVAWGRAHNRFVASV